MREELVLSEQIIRNLEERVAKLEKRLEDTRQVTREIFRELFCEIDELKK